MGIYTLFCIYSIFKLTFVKKILNIMTKNRNKKGVDKSQKCAPTFFPIKTALKKTFLA